VNDHSRVHGNFGGSGGSLHSVCFGKGGNPSPFSLKDGARDVRSGGKDSSALGVNSGVSARGRTREMGRPRPRRSETGGDSSLLGSTGLEDVGDHFVDFLFLSMIEMMSANSSSSFLSNSARIEAFISLNSA